MTEIKLDFIMDASVVLSSWETSLRIAECLSAKVCVKPNLSLYYESLILAQDERWRRA